MPTIIAVDMMGSDVEPDVLMDGVALAARARAEARFVLHGDAERLRRASGWTDELAKRCDIRHAERVIAMTDKPSEVVRNARGASMAQALDSVAAGEAGVAVSCGNTGALMALSVMTLGRAEGVSRPAIAILWPKFTPGKQTVVLDVGADVRMEPENLRQYAVMGAAFARIALATPRPRVGLLNIGAETHKGKPQLHEAAELIALTAATQDFDYCGFVEANQIPMDEIDVVVTDGFTGNVALKAAEGAAMLIGRRMRLALEGSLRARLGALLAAPALREMRRSLDPSRNNGGVFLGLAAPVVKSHGSVDAIGFSSAVALAARIAEEGLVQSVARRLANDAVA